MCIRDRFLAAIGKEERNPKDAQYGTIMGVLVLTLAVLIVGSALIKNIDLVGASQIPLLLILHQSSPFLATVFSVVIFAGIYTTACPLLWTPVNLSLIHIWYGRIYGVLP